MPDSKLPELAGTSHPIVQMGRLRQRENTMTQDCLYSGLLLDFILGLPAFRKGWVWGGILTEWECKRG